METFINHAVAFWSALLLLIMQISYNHEGKRYKDGKELKIEELASFKAFYLWVRIVQLPAILAAIYLNFGHFPVGSPAKVLGLLLSLLSTAIFVHAKSILGRNYSPCYDSFLPVELVKKGIYKFIRHPIYSANIVNFFAMFIYSGSYVVGLNMLILSYFYYRSAKVEEVKLGEVFEEYRNYVKTSGRFLPNLGYLFGR